MTGTSAVNNTNEAEAEQPQPLLNITEAEAPVGDVTEPEATEGEATEGEVVEEVVTEGEATEAEAEEGAAESEATEAAATPPATATPASNVTRTQALKNWGSHVLASKYMGSLAVLYLALCLFLAIKQGPLFVR